MGDFGGQDVHGASLILRSKYSRVLQPSLCQINTAWDQAGSGGILLVEMGSHEVGLADGFDHP